MLTRLAFAADSMLSSHSAFMNSCSPLQGHPVLITMERCNLAPAPIAMGVPQAYKSWDYQQGKTAQGDTSNREHSDLLGKSQTGEMKVRKISLCTVFLKINFSLCFSFVGLFSYNSPTLSLGKPLGFESLGREFGVCCSQDSCSF